jgi:uncharacterized protein YjbI with pentapeptide repeats
MVLEADAWDSTISFAAGIPVALGGTLELGFAADVNIADQVGRTLELFDWTGVSPTGTFDVASAYPWDLSRLYTTGEVTLLSPFTPGDANGDQFVDRADVAILARSLGRADDVLWSHGDFDNNRRVDMLDVAILQSHLGEGPIASNVAVAEPSTWALAGFVVIGLVVRCRRRHKTVQQRAVGRICARRSLSSRSTNMTRRTVFLGFACVGLVLTAEVSATTYTFSNLIDTSVAAPTGNYLNIGDAAISGNTVAFKAGYNQGFLGIIDSIFTSSGGPRTQIIQELRDYQPGRTISAIGRPAIEGSNVYFDSRVYLGLFDYGDGVFYGYGLRHVNGNLLVDTAVSPLQHLVTVNAPKVVADPLISQGFRAYLGSANTINVKNPQNSFFTRIVGAGDAAPPGGTFSSIDANYGLSGGTAAFRGLYGNQEGIFTGAGGALTTIAKIGDLTPTGEAFTGVLDPAISGGTVAFLGTFAGGSGIFTGESGVLSTVVKTGDATPDGDVFSGFSVPTVAFNTIAFRGDYPGGGGIYAKRGNELGKVVEIGDPLFGSTVASLSFSDLGLDRGGTGNLAFNYALADGRSGVAMAVPGAGLPTIYQRNGLPVPDSAGIVWVPYPNFEHRNLTNAVLGGADLRNANARNVNLTDAWLRQADLTNADLRDANLSRAVFDSARLSGANLNGADVSGARFTREFFPVAECFVDHCTVVPVGNGGITPAQLGATTSYRDRNLAGIDLEGNSLPGVNLAGQNLTGANFTYAWLNGADLAGAEIRGASFGRYFISVTGLCDQSRPTCAVASDIIGSGISLDQLYSTTSYLARDLTGVNFGGNDLAGGNFSGQNLTGAYFGGDVLYGSPAANLANADFSHAMIHNANFRGARLAGASLTGADARGASFTDAVLTDSVLTNFIQSDGHIAGLGLGAGETLLIRDYDGDLAHGIAPPPITVDQHFAMGPGGTLRMILEGNAWDSTLSFAADIPATLGGTLELSFAPDAKIADQIGRTIDLFDWTGVNPTGAFNISSPYPWDVSELYTTGEVTLLSPFTPGDANGDQFVDRADAAILAANLGMNTGALWSNGDFDGNRIVDLLDAAILQSHLGQGPIAPSTSVIPEPPTLTLAALAVFGFAARFRQRPRRSRCTSAHHGEQK